MREFETETIEKGETCEVYTFEDLFATYGEDIINDDDVFKSLCECYKVAFVEKENTLMFADIKPLEYEVQKTKGKSGYWYDIYVRYSGGCDWEEWEPSCKDRNEPMNGHKLRQGLKELCKYDYISGWKDCDSVFTKEIWKDWASKQNEWLKWKKEEEQKKRRAEQSARDKARYIECNNKLSEIMNKVSLPVKEAIIQSGFADDIKKGNFEVSYSGSIYRKNEKPDPYTYENKLFKVGMSFIDMHEPNNPKFKTWNGKSWDEINENNLNIKPTKEKQIGE